MAVQKTMVATWVGIVLVIIATLGGAGAWAVAQHENIEARAEVRVLRSDDRNAASIQRLENKIDILINYLLPPPRQ